MSDKKYSDNEWEELASMLSGEAAGRDELLHKFASGDTSAIPGQWKVLRTVNEQENIDVDRAWGRLSSRIGFPGDELISKSSGMRLIKGQFLRIAATILLVTGIASALFYIAGKSSLTGRKTISTGIAESNVMVKLPDGSSVWLNRNTRLSYRFTRESKERSVTLTGEAFFDIAPDSSRPFIVDAGKAMVKVIGTSFNVITSNDDSAVEVFVKTGRVIMAGGTPDQTVVLDPGFVGTINESIAGKKLNEDRNYLAWNTGQLTYDGQKLGVVFNDLRKLYGIDIITADSSISDLPLDGTFSNEPHETIIRVICTTFNLTYRQDGNIYHLGKK